MTVVLRVFIVLSMCVPCATFAQSSRLSGAFLHFGYGANEEVIRDDQIPALLDELQDLGNDAIIVNQTRAGKTQACATSSAQFEWVKGFPSKLSTLLGAAHSRGMSVFVGTTLSSGCWNFWQGTNSLSIEQDVYQSHALIAQQYASHPAFSGWYVSDEPGLLDADKHAHYQRVVAALKAVAPGKLVLVAPHFSEAESLSPATIASRALAFRSATGVDIQVWQDNLGATKLFHWSRAGYSSEQYYSALASALGASGLWADIEVFNYGKPLINRVGGVMTGGYRSASATRINQQLWSARAAAKRVSWLHQWHMSEVIGPSRGYVEAPLAQGLYRSIYGIGGAARLTSLNYSGYSFGTSPNASYADSTGFELFDGQTGDPMNPTDRAWIGIPGAAGVVKITVDLGVAKKTDWIGLHMLTYPSWGIRSSTSADVYCGQSLGSLNKVATISSPFSAAALLTPDGEEYLLGNTSPISAVCRFIELRVATNGSWLFVSELELASD